MPVPYIGITDFTTFSEVERMLEVFNKNKGDRNRRLHVGVMMSRKTLLGLETKWTKAFPPKENIASIFASDQTMNCLHYADYDKLDLVDNLIEAIGYGGKNITAMQLDMVWPDPDSLALTIGVAGKPLEVVLQVNGPAMSQCNDDPVEVVERLRDYGPEVKYILLDKSMGKGLGMDAESLLPFVDKISEELPHLSCAVAGGLGPNSMKLLDPIAQKYPHISIDAQGKLRPSGSALDPIDWDMAAEYLRKALNILG